MTTLTAAAAMARFTIELEKESPMTISLCLAGCDVDQHSPIQMQTALTQAWLQYLAPVYRGLACRKKMICAALTELSSPPSADIIRAPQKHCSARPAIAVDLIHWFTNWSDANCEFGQRR